MKWVRFSPTDSEGRSNNSVANPSKSDDWKWSIDKGAFVIK